MKRLWFLAIPLLFGGVLLAVVELRRAGVHATKSSKTASSDVQTASNSVPQRPSTETGVLDGPSPPEGLDAELRELWDRYLEALRACERWRAYPIGSEMLRRVPLAQRAELDRRLREADETEEQRTTARRHVPRGPLLTEEETRRTAVLLSGARDPAEIEKLSREIKEREIPVSFGRELVEIISRTPDSKARSILIGLLNNMPDPESARWLSQLMRADWSKEVRLAAVELLRCHHEDPLEQSLYVRLFRGETDPDLRAAFAGRLRTKDPEAASLLRSCVEDSDERLRSFGADALSVTRPDDLAMLIRMLKSDPSRHVRYAAHLPLTEDVKNLAPEAIEALAWAAQHDSDASNRSWLISSLSDSSYCNHPGVRSALEAIALSDPDSSNQEKARRALNDLDEWKKALDKWDK